MTTFETSQHATLLSQLDIVQGRCKGYFINYLDVNKTEEK